MNNDEALWERRHRSLVEWRRLYIESIIDELNPSGTVLEIGFGSGEGAKHIETFYPQSLTIIEADPQIAAAVRSWASQYQNITIIQDSWKNCISQLGVFDTIFYNDYPAEAEIAPDRFIDMSELELASAETEKLINKIEEQMSLRTFTFSDQEIDDFYQKIGQYHMHKMSRFFDKLKERGHITDSQYERVVHSYQLRSGNERRKATPATPKQEDAMLECLEDCIQSHMHKGSRFSSFLMSPISKYNDTLFFEHIITNPELDYHEKLIPIKVADFKPIDSLVMVVETL